MLSTDKTSSKEVTVSLKCGLLRGQHLIGDFQFVTWSYNEQKPYLTYPGLATRIKSSFPNVNEPFNIILIDDDNDRIVIPGDDMKETIAAFNCFRHRYPSPLRVFLQLPAEPAIREEEKEQDAKLVEDALSEVITSLKLLVDQSNNVLDVMQRIADSLRINEDACQTAKEQMNIACEEIAKLKAHCDSQLLVHRVSDDSIETASSPINILAPSNLSGERTRSESSSESHYEEDDWTPVGHGLGAAPRRRRRLTTTSSCASSEPLNEDMMQLMADEFDTVMMGFQRSP